MNSYAQNKEDLLIADYFGDYKGTLLSVGENDGVTFSNARLLIEKGWSAHLIEPSDVFIELEFLYLNNPKVTCHKIAIGNSPGEYVTMMQSGPHVMNGNDKCLVSSLNPDDVVKWKKSGVIFEPIKVFITNYTDFCENRAKHFDFNFITLDAEGYDWIILQQIDLTNTKCLIIEHNGDERLKTDYCRYCIDKYGMKVALVNAENIIFIK